MKKKKVRLWAILPIKMYRCPVDIQNRNRAPLMVRANTQEQLIQQADGVGVGERLSPESREGTFAVNSKRHTTAMLPPFRTSMAWQLQNELCSTCLAAPIAYLLQIQEDAAPVAPRDCCVLDPQRSATAECHALESQSPAY